MEHQKYRNAIFSMWEYIESEDFNTTIIEKASDSEEYTTCGLCNPEFGAAYNRSIDQPCPFDKRSVKDMSDSPCSDSCRIFVDGFTVYKLKIYMSKFMIKMLTTEAISSVKSIAKAGRGMKGVSNEAADNHIIVANKIKNHIKAFGGYDFRIEGSLIKADRSNG